MKKGGAAKGELVLAMYELANSFRHGWGVEKDPVAARSYYETAANLGDTDAMNEVARCYEEGFGGKKDKVRRNDRDSSTGSSDREKGRIELRIMRLVFSTPGPLSIDDPVERKKRELHLSPVCNLAVPPSRWAATLPLRSEIKANHSVSSARQ